MASLFSSTRAAARLSLSRVSTRTLPSVTTRIAPSVRAMSAETTWIGHKGRGGFDLRSDVMTTPTTAMLAAVQKCSLLDDVFEEDTTTADLEAHVASLVGKEAGLFVLSGTMGNQLALRSLLTQPPHAVLCDARSHIVQHEAGGVSSLTGAMLQTVMPSNGVYLTLEDVKRHAVVDNNVHSCPTRVISLENTLDGTVMPLSEARRIAFFAREHGIALHCDGARLWEAVASGAASLSEYCSLFDTVSLCFSKGLGAPVGSMLVGPRDTLAHARWVRKSIGGGLRQPGPLTAAARVALDDTFGSALDGSQGLLPSTHALAREVADLWSARGGAFSRPVETNMCWLDMEAAPCDSARFVELGAQNGLRLGDSRLVIHYQVAQNRDEVLQKLTRVFDAVFAAGSA